MANTNHPMLVPTSHYPNFRGSVQLSPDVLQDAQVYYQQHPVYGAPSMVSSTAVARPQHVVRRVGDYTEHPDWAQYEHVVIWLQANDGRFRAPIGYSVAAQKARTFGGVSMPYYQAYKAPSPSAIARNLGGVINGR